MTTQQSGGHLRFTSTVRHGLAVVIFGGLAAVIAGCGNAGSSPSASPVAAATSASGGAGGTGGTLVVGMTAGNIPALDTVEAGGQGYEGIRFVGNQLYDSLTRYNLDQSTQIPAIEPALASSWSVNKTATIWTFHLRPGVRFTDGTPWNAAAAVFNFDRYLDPNFRYTSPTLVGLAGTYVGTVKSTQAIGPMTLQVTTKVPDSHLPEDLSTAFMASPTAVKKEGVAGFAAHPVGTGPFKFASEIQGQQLTLIRNPTYWRGTPKLQTLILKPIPDPSQRIAALRSGSVNWIEYPNPDDISSLQSSGYQVLSNSYDHIWPWVLDTVSGPTKDVRVRQAMNYAINRQAMVSNLLHGTATAAYQVAPPANAAYGAANNLYSYDPTKAKTLLKAAGYPHGFSLTVEYPTSGSGNMIPGPMNQELQSDLASVGIKVNLKPIEWATELTQFVSGKFPAGIQAENISLSFQQEAFWLEAFGSKGPINAGHYSDPKVDKLLAQAQSVVQPAARNQIYSRAARIITQDAAWLDVVNDRNPRALAKNVHGFNEPRSWFIDLTKTWVG
jgi:peptide/nickel transport system substrate-binding protein